MMNHHTEFFDTYKLAASTKNKSQMSGLYHQDVQWFDIWNDYQVQGSDKINALVADWFDSLGDEQLEVEFSAVTTKQHGDVAFASAFVHFRAVNAAGKVLRQMKNRITLGFIKTNTTWSVLHQHTSIPISIRTMQGIFE